MEVINSIPADQFTTKPLLVSSKDITSPDKFFESSVDLGGPTRGFFDAMGETIMNAATVNEEEGGGGGSVAEDGGLHIGSIPSPHGYSSLSFRQNDTPQNTQQHQEQHTSLPLIADHHKQQQEQQQSQFHQQQPPNTASSPSAASVSKFDGFCYLITQGAESSYTVFPCAMGLLCMDGLQECLRFLGRLVGCVLRLQDRNVVLRATFGLPLSSSCE